MSHRQFSERLNKELDEIGVPQPTNERINVFAKLTKTPRFKAEAILNGTLIPDPTLLNTLADELEVSVQWLLGETDKKH